MPEDSTRNIEIDRLRAVAILITMYAHLDFVMLGSSPMFTASKAYFDAGSGVTLFFAISGYVISKSLLPALDAAKMKRQVLISFWIKRSARIVPMAWLWVLVPLACSYFYNSRSIFQPFSDNVDGAIAAMLFVFNVFENIVPLKSMFGAYWTLALEEQFYILFPGFLMLLKDRRLRLGGLLAVAIGLAMIPTSIRSVRADAIIYGVALFVWSQNAGWGFDRTRLSASAPVWVGTAVATVLLVTLLTCKPMLADAPKWFLPIPPALIATALVAAAAQRRGFIIPLGQTLNAIVDWVGTRSFGLYLVHVPAYMFAGETTWRLQMFDTIPGRGCIAFIVMIAVTEICYRWFETPIRNKGRNWGLTLANGSQSSHQAQLRRT
jgi:peptidoglycan/LPS O-acetylase OafA/YrhL